MRLRPPRVRSCAREAARDSRGRSARRIRADRARAPHRFVRLAAPLVDRRRRAPAPARKTDRDLRLGQERQRGGQRCGVAARRKRRWAFCQRVDRRRGRLRGRGSAGAGGGLRARDAARTRRGQRLRAARSRLFASRALALRRKRSRRSRAVGASPNSAQRSATQAAAGAADPGPERRRAVESASDSSLARAVRLSPEQIRERRQRLEAAGIGGQGGPVGADRGGGTSGARLDGAERASAST